MAGILFTNTVWAWNRAGKPQGRISDPKPLPSTRTTIDRPYLKKEPNQKNKAMNARIKLWRAACPAWLLAASLMSLGTGTTHASIAYGTIRYNWLVDDGFGNLVHGGAVQVSTPTFTYFPAAPGACPRCRR